MVLIEEKERLMAAVRPLISFVSKKDEKLSEEIEKFLGGMDESSLMLVLHIIKFSVFFALEEPKKSGNFLIKKIFPALRKKKKKKRKDSSKKKKKLVAFFPVTGERVYE